MTHRLVVRRTRDGAADWSVDDMDDTIGCWQVGLDYSVNSAWILGQYETLQYSQTDR